MFACEVSEHIWMVGYSFSHVFEKRVYAESMHQAENMHQTVH